MKRFGSCMLLGIFFIIFAATASIAAEQTDSTPPVKAAAVKKKTRKRSSKPKADLVDINSATAEQLKSLPGITDEDAQKIIAGRPYAKKNELKQKNVISASAYDGIKAKIVAKKPLNN